MNPLQDIVELSARWNCRPLLAAILVSATLLAISPPANGFEYFNPPYVEVFSNSSNVLVGRIVGSLHSNYYGPNKLSTRVTKFLSDSSPIYFESNPDSKAAKADMSNLLWITRLVGKDNELFWTAMHARAKLLRTELLSNLISHAQARNLHPYQLLLLIASTCEVLPDKSNGSVDQIIREQASPSAAIRYLETVDDQFSWWRFVDRDAWIEIGTKILDYSADAGCQAAYQTYWQNFLQAFIIGRTIEVYSLTKRHYENRLGSDFFLRTISGRNTALAEKIISRLSSETRPVFVIGALHLGGDDGLIEILQKRGFTARQAQ
jgi:uncharacterized protein YbaP (TraB family)